jgi:prevent-host-death family protein
MSTTLPKTTVNFTEARSHLSELINQVTREETRVVIEKHGVPVGVIVSPRDLKDLERMAERRTQQIEAFRRVGEAFADVSEEEIEREVAKALAEVRAEMRAEREAAARMRAEREAATKIAG